MDIPRVVRNRIREIGYDRAKYGFDSETCGVIVAIDEQSADIAQGVDESYEVQHDPGDDDPLDLVGAGDQGMMFGYACTETEELMPLPIMLAHRIAQRLSEVRKADVLPYLRPDGKAQVTVRYEVDAHGRQRPVEIERVLVSTQHRDGLDVDALIKPDLIEHVLHPILPRELYDERRLEERDFVYVNPTGKFVIGGPDGRHGRSPAARSSWTPTAARPATAAGPSPARIRRRSTARPPTPRATSRRTSSPPASPTAASCRSPTRSASRTRSRSRVECFGTETLPVARIEELVREHFDLRPGAILRDLDLRRPIYAKTAAYGHFGRADHDFTWERTDKADALRAAAGVEAEVPA